MKTRKVIVQSRVDGAEVPADVVLCPKCENDEFSVFVIGGRHLHFQCAACAETFCDQSCAAVPS